VLTSLWIGAVDYPESACLPPGDTGDFGAYFVLKTSYITAKQFKTHKSLEAYNQYTNKQQCMQFPKTGPSLYTETRLSWQ